MVPKITQQHMAQMINLTVMGGSAAPYSSSGPTGNPWQTKFGGASGLSEQQSFTVANIIKMADYVQPATGTQYPAVKTVIRYKGINPTNGLATNVKLYVNEVRTAIVTSANA